MKSAIGFVLGSLALLDGAVGMLAPRWGFKVWDQSLKQYFPESVDQVAQQFFGLPLPAIRCLGVWESILGAALLWLSAGAGRQEGAPRAE